MEVQLEQLVEKIRKDGVEAAESRAADILKDAESRAEAIVREAKAEAASIVREAKAEAERSTVAGAAALKQAGRNLLISFRDGVQAELEAIVRRETSTSYDAALLSAMIPKIVAAWVEKTGEDDLAILLPKSDLDRLEAGLTAALRAEIARGLVIKAQNDLSSGFRIAAKDGSAYYDFSAGAVADLISAYLSPRVADILKASAKEL